jgi:rare lipoprotein A (RlpA)-like double-psi beta-barrel protein
MKRRNRIMRRRAAALALATAAIGTGTATAAHAAGGATALDASDNRVGPNSSVTLDGRFPTPDPTDAPAAGNGGSQSRAQAIRIEFRPLGSKRWRNADQARTGRNGRFSERVAVTRSGRFRAVSSDGRVTRPELVIVRSALRTRIGNEDPNLGDKVTVAGHVLPANGGRRVTVQVDGDTLSTKTGKSGAFKVRYKPSEAGTETVRVRAEGDEVAAGSGEKAGKVTTFRPAGASYYGPGLYGNGVACGGTLQPDTIGVANKTLPCGTKLTIRYGNREVKNVEVIDRGPYVAGREFDLTEALRNKLGFGGVGTVYVDK